jgi:hypothetical protein
MPSYARYGLVVVHSTPSSAIQKAVAASGVGLDRVDDGGTVLVADTSSWDDALRVAAALARAGVVVHRVAHLA